MKIIKLSFLAAVISHAIAVPIDETSIELSAADFSDEDFAEYYKNDMLEFDFPDEVDDGIQDLHERAATFIPPGRISQDCSIGTQGFYSSSVNLAKKLQSEPGYHFVKKHDCKNIAKAHASTPSAGGYVCYAMCARGQNRVIHNKRLGTIAADINVGCHSGLSFYINGVDYFPNYIIEIHACVDPNPSGREVDNATLSG